MSNKYLCYLSGPITGLTYKNSEDWRDFVTQSFPPHILGISPLRAERYLNLSDKPIDSAALHQDIFPMSTDRAINTRDRFDTLRSAAILVNLLGAKRASIGTAMEIAWAYDHSIPIICAMEPEGNIHDHPMIRDSISIRVASLEEAIEATVGVISPQEKYMYTLTDQTKMLMQTHPVPSTPATHEIL